MSARDTRFLLVAFAVFPGCTSQGAPASDAAPVSTTTAEPGAGAMSSNPPAASPVAGAGGAPEVAPTPSTPSSGTPVPGGAGGEGGAAAGGAPAALHDAGAHRGGGSGFSTDAGTACAPFVMPEDCTIPDGAVLPAELRCTGLYQDWAGRELHCSVLAYEPAYALWSDGSEKHRYVSIPPGATVDVSDPDDFRYPIGTRFWKEFRTPEGERLLETRLLERVDGGWLYTSYVWDEMEANALQNNDGVGDLHGSGHTVPSRQQCKECHAGRPDYVLGWDGILLGEGATGLTREDLAAAPWVTWDGKDDGAPSPLDLEIPGDELERAALGTLHANCGVSCHNDTSFALALETGFFTRLDAEALDTVQATLTFSTGFLRPPSPNAPLSELAPPPGGQDYVDLRPLDPEGSLALVRMQLRNEDAAMPRIGTNVVDTEGVEIVREWIETMTEERGYPAVTE